MPFILAHLSDIHFGQEKKSGIYVHEDVRERLLDDARGFVEEISPKSVGGVIVTGDIAYAGTEVEYAAAGKWLDQLTDIFGCKRSDIQLVPGNHDIDRGEISFAAKHLLDEIAEHGEDRLNTFLENETDRELLYRRFHAYSKFAEAYNCPLDKEGGRASDRRINLAPSRHLRITGLNTALACSMSDKEGKLMLGERQRVLPRNVGEELVVLAHHPLKWLADHDDAYEYVKARARVLVTGHEHSPGVRVEGVLKDADLLTIEAGATVPPWVNDEYTYTYNYLEFDFDFAENALAVTIHARCWNEERKEFEVDNKRIDPNLGRMILKSPRFAEAPELPADYGTQTGEALPAPTMLIEIQDGEAGTSLMPELYSDIVFRFFRDLTPAQRLRLLLEIGALPEEWDGDLSHTHEKALLDRALQSNQADAVHAKLNDLISSSQGA